MRIIWLCIAIAFLAGSSYASGKIKANPYFYSEPIGPETHVNKCGVDDNLPAQSPYAPGFTEYCAVSCIFVGGFLFSKTTRRSYNRPLH